MPTNNTVYLLVGQRGAGKSTYAEKILSAQSEVQLISRDAILMRLFGLVDFDEYGGESSNGDKIAKRLLRRRLSLQTGIKIIFDFFTEPSSQRRNMILWLRAQGAEKVVALYFVTPVHLVSEWFWKKPGIAKAREMKTRVGENLSFFCEDAPVRDYEVFHKRLAFDIDSDGFDTVIRINPLDPVITL